MKSSPRHSAVSITSKGLDVGLPSVVKAPLYHDDPGYAYWGKSGEDRVIVVTDQVPAEFAEFFVELVNADITQSVLEDVLKRVNPLDELRFIALAKKHYEMVVSFYESHRSVNSAVNVSVARGCLRTLEIRYTKLMNEEGGDTILDLEPADPLGDTEVAVTIEEIKERAARTNFN